MIDRTIDKSVPVIINRDNNTRQIIFLQDDDTGFSVVEIWNEKHEEWREICGHWQDAETTQKFIEGVLV